MEDVELSPRHAVTNERFKITLSADDVRKLADENCNATVTDQTTGATWLIEPAPCGLGCYCDTIAMPVQ